MAQQGLFLCYGMGLINRFYASQGLIVIVTLGWCRDASTRHIGQG